MNIANHGKIIQIPFQKENYICVFQKQTQMKRLIENICFILKNLQLLIVRIYMLE